MQDEKVTLETQGPADETEALPQEGLATEPQAVPRRHWALRLIPLLLAVIAIGVAIKVLQGDAPGASVSLPGATSTYKLTSGQPAPPFTATALTGEPVSLDSLRGKAVVINFWATWCPPCRSEMPDLEQVYTGHKDNDVVVLAVNVQEAPEIINRFVHQYGLSFPVLLDTSGAISQTYGVQSLPTTIFVDKAGQISTYQMGALNKSAIEKRLTTSLE